MWHPIAAPGQDWEHALISRDRSKQRVLPPCVCAYLGAVDRGKASPGTMRTDGTPRPGCGQVEDRSMNLGTISHAKHGDEGSPRFSASSGVVASAGPIPVSRKPTAPNLYWRFDATLDKHVKGALDIGTL